MTLAFKDSAQIIWEFLTATSTGLYTLVGKNVVRPLAPAGYDNTYALVVFHIQGEVPSGQTDVTRVDVVFKCYGGAATNTSATTVYRALANRWHSAQNTEMTTGKILQAHITTAWQRGPEPGETWPTHMAIGSALVR